ncbi:MULTISPECIES: DUF2771 domain-containing protein [unclassified Streptomyces]|jgi:hypothetical protein|uniref:DUF2771 domain-containing protein n=1 Tax=unclassified Streptomyces TaxID=2593676 RepID=UPI002DDA3D06|nr:MULTISPECIES: DUF2771 domain-containing protein [unclassified Streptomyces]WSF85274.1 DUF2771 domain-containing protein [Streptomyces sp. NBC_01744]WSC38436.1 DUF2771 domain-containing protein [Streptomyces sp. NBC_01763]WSC46573.1 DUF2771 domain-containing protein [Streptomyces sp. NBC_01762]WSC54435.1 DUF2771 domain-containing protein [Streptomyces sp. NBC_01761]WSD26224.1 DUF2771 domain-containing protein [Streptomyces sp. NBC_01751]
MTVAFFSGKGRRIGVALGAVSAGLLVLSACDKPTPLATVTVGDTSVTTEASCYNDGDALKDSQIKTCLNKKAEKSVKVAMDDKVRFGVDPEIADKGWTLFINGQQAEQEPYKRTYRSIPGSAFFSSQTGETTNKTQISIVETDGKKLTGIWHFELKKTD